MTMVDVPNVVLVEGPDDLHAIAGFLRRHNLTERVESSTRGRLLLRWKAGAVESRGVEIISAAGVEQVKDFNKTLAGMERVDTRERVALIVDADENAQTRWESIANRLKESGYSPPRAPELGGTIMESPELETARVGVWIMPDNSSAGMLESFLRYSVPQRAEPLWQTAESTVDEIRANFPEEIRFKTAHLDKAKMHTYLAWRDPPGVPIGQAIVKGLLSHDSDRTRTFLQWLSQTLELPLAADAA
jgi:hypothetical protein